METSTPWRLFLAISGLDPTQLQKNFTRKHEIDGIIEYHDSRGFYKSTLSEKFSDSVEARSDGAFIPHEAKFTFQIIPGSKGSPMKVSGRRLLTIRKNFG